MKAASKGTYLSMKQMSAYTKKRDEARSKKGSVVNDLIQPKGVSQDVI